MSIYCSRENPGEGEFFLWCEHNVRLPQRECDCFRCKERRSLANQILGLYEKEKQQFDSMLDEDIKRTFREIAGRIWNSFIIIKCDRILTAIGLEAPRPPIAKLLPSDEDDKEEG